MQLFFDGNKRSTLFLCNLALIKNNLGLFFVNHENIIIFNENLMYYYQNININIVNFIENNLIKSFSETEDLYLKIKR